MATKTKEKIESVDMGAPAMPPTSEQAAPGEQTTKVLNPAQVQAAVYLAATVIGAAPRVAGVTGTWLHMHAPAVGITGKLKQEVEEGLATLYSKALETLRVKRGKAAITAQLVLATVTESAEDFHNQALATLDACKVEGKNAFTLCGQVFTLPDKMGAKFLSSLPSVVAEKRSKDAADKTKKESEEKEAAEKLAIAEADRASKLAKFHVSPEYLAMKKRHEVSSTTSISAIRAAQDALSLATSEAETLEKRQSLELRQAEEMALLSC